MREIAFTIIDSLLPLLHSSLLLKRSLGTDRLTKWLQFPCFINNLMEEVHLSEKTNRRMGLVFPLPLWPPRASLVLGPPTWTRGGWASNSEFPPSSGPPGHMNFLGPNQVLGWIIVHQILQKMRNLLKFAEICEFDCFLTKAKDARGDINYLWDLSISQSQATWETIRGQHATHNKICSCQINHLEIFPCPFTSILCQEKSLSGIESTWGWGARRRACREGSQETPVSLALPREPWPGSLEAVPACCLLSVGSGARRPILWA